MNRVGYARTNTPHMTACMVLSLLEMLY